ncbi:MAG: hypothetical protein JNM93_04070 [Bacteriovoracaceae bacterium]|nr:hypothetical protein [Bacteriovoracaceae bacterium]
MGQSLIRFLILSCLLSCTAGVKKFPNFYFGDERLSFFKQSWRSLEHKWNETIPARTEKLKLENHLIYAYYTSRKRIEENNLNAGPEIFKDPNFELWRWLKQDELINEELFLNFKEVFKKYFLIQPEAEISSHFLLAIYRNLFKEFSSVSDIHEVIRNKNLYFEPRESDWLFLSQNKTEYLKEIRIKNQNAYRYPDLSDFGNLKHKLSPVLKKQLEHDLKQPLMDKVKLLPLFLQGLMEFEITQYDKSLSSFDIPEEKIKKVFKLVRNLAFIAPFKANNSLMIHIVFLYEITKNLGTYPPVNMDAWDLFSTEEQFVRKTQDALAAGQVYMAYFYNHQPKAKNPIVLGPHLSAYLVVQEGVHYQFDLYDYVQFVRLASQQSYHEVARLKEYETYLHRWSQLYKLTDQKTVYNKYVKFIPDEWRKMFFEPMLTDERKWKVKNAQFLTPDIAHEGIATQRVFTDAELFEMFYQSGPMLAANISLKKDLIAGSMHAMDLFNESRRNRKYFEKLIHESMNKNIHGIFYTANSEYKDAEVQAHGLGNTLEFLKSVRGKMLITFKIPWYGMINLNELNLLSSTPKFYQNIFIAGGIDPDSIQSIEFWDIIPLEYSADMQVITKAQIIKYRKIYRDEMVPFRLHFIEESDSETQNKTFDVIKDVDDKFKLI